MATLNDLEDLQNGANHAAKDGILFSNSDEDYRAVLAANGIAYKEDGYYLQVGEISKVQGWILHFSVTKYKFCEFINIVIPILLGNNIPFKIPATKKLKDNLIEGVYGYVKMGKALCVYPDTDERAVLLIKELSELSTMFDGPAIPTDIKLNNIAYTRYGSFAPIVKNDEYGVAQNYIYNVHNNLIIDPYNIPYKFLKGTSWPFAEIAAPIIPKLSKMYKGKYLPYVIIKSDAKGRVIKAINIAKLTKPQYCIIKEGKKCICSDEHGRDIIDKLIWQRDLHKALSPTIPLPEIIDFFEENDNAYLVMEFIDGQSLDDFQEKIFKGSSWLELSVDDKVAILDCLIKIIKVIEQLHEIGYVHRDITIPNFMIDKKGEVVLIDMELAYDIWNKVPNPHFELGTPGSMSPEQLQSLEPTYAQDIYGLGTLLLLSMIRLWPIYFDVDDPITLYKNLLFFINDGPVCLMISKCLSKDPADRPGIAEIMEQVVDYKKRIQTGAIEKVPVALNESKVQDTTLSALNGLLCAEIVSPDLLWHSMPQVSNKEVGSIRKDDTVFMGLHEGISGVMYLLSEAYKAGFIVDNSAILAKNWDYLRSNLIDSDATMPAGLYAGSTGIAFALSKGLSAEIIADEEGVTNFIRNTCLQEGDGLDVSSGIAGQGLGLLRSCVFLSATEKKEKLAAIAKTIFERQLPDGSWYFLHEESGKKEKKNGFSYGIAGVIFFLLEYYQEYKDAEALQRAEKGLQYLIKRAKKVEGKLTISISSDNKAVDGFFSIGIYGIALTFIKVFEVTNNAQYRSFAEQLLIYHSPKIVDINYTQSFGLAGVGEVYLEAYRVFKDPAWMERADWIAGVFAHTATYNGDAAYWLIDNPMRPHADLMIGNSGIVHYLLRYLHSDKIGLIIFS